MEFLQQHKNARKDFDEAFNNCSIERQESLRELLGIVSKRDVSRVVDAVEHADNVQKRENRLSYFHGKPRKRKS